VDDAEFLEQCGVERDARWLLEIACIGVPEEARNYALSLLRIYDALGGKTQESA
jgi:hypothetical protein